MCNSLFSLLIKSSCNISKATSSSDDCCLGRLVNDNVFEVLHVDYEMTILAAKTVGGIAVATRFGGDLDAIDRATRHCILDLFDR